MGTGASKGVKRFAAAIMVAWAALPAQAATFSTWNDGALRMKLQINSSTGEAWLINLNSSAGQGGAVTLSTDIDALSITSTGGNLVPTLTWNATTKTVTNGWFSIADSVAKRTALALNNLGENVPGFGRATATASNLTEVNLSGYATFIADTTLPLDTPWSIGKPLKPGLASLADLRFYYHTPTIGGNQFVGVVELITPINRVPGDANGDGQVDLQDFGALKDNFGTTAGATWAQGDFTGDGAIDLQDFSILKVRFGLGPSSVQAVPEPTTLAGLAGALVLWRRRGRR